MARKRTLPLKIDKWDSDFFKTRIARLKLSGKKTDRNFPGKLSDLLNLARKQNVAFLVIKMENPIPTYEKTLVNLGFKKYSESVDSVFRYPKSIKKSYFKEHKVRLFKPADRTAVCAIAKDAFRLSYLYKCGFSRRSEVDRYHLVWAENLTRDRNSKVFVAEKGERANGFATLSLDRLKKRARVILIAVDKKCRGRGVGKALMQKCIAWGQSARLKAIFIKTQRNNYKALNLYKQLGFRPAVYDKVFCKKL